ncbi:hypothetical protein GCM10010404_61710 [Nonomuraea africana]|uniref:Zn-ribbon and HTH transcriptional regulator n=1 Tax=Nonomuraea africana TaxID=46171 RepID=A0ABR9K752_9ACTN|nr:putative Zn-ribbon and HTH transcriptional regulator [Nonomuraea africana]
MIREVGGAVPVAAAHCTACDYRDPGKPCIAWNDEQARAHLVDALMGDAIALLANLPEQPLDDKIAGAVGLLVDEQAPVQLFADIAYDSGDARCRLHQTGHRLVIKPPRCGRLCPGGFTLDDFASTPPPPS